MQRNRPPSPQAINVLRALAADPARWRYGYDLAAEVHLKSGSLYPILVRLADRGCLGRPWRPGRDGARAATCGARPAAPGGPAPPPRLLQCPPPAGREYVAARPAARAGRAVPRS